MNTLHTYIPQDRLRALARGETLPDRTTGSALFADISGFTPLTEGLRDSLGPRRGAEELTQHLDTVYTALITEIERYGGSVIGFAGDAVTCWFDNAGDGGRELGDASQRAVACAFALQEVMQAFKAIALPNGTTTALALKVAVASGPARRFVVGDPSIHYMDALAGATVARTSTGEHLSERGDVLLDEATVNAVGDKLTIKEWRIDDESNERFAAVTGLGDRGQGLERADAQSPTPEVPLEQLRDWLHKAQVEREQSFLTEFRPCAALFVRFSGIDYDSDEAEKQLDAFVRQMQTIVNRYEGTVIQLTIGDKGSYAYINFGALSTHEDDARRAVKAALDIKNSTALQLQMGLTQGTMRVGAYGGQTRRTYGALSDEVNLAARLMSTALPGEILLGGQIQKTTANDFVSEPRSPLAMKGKAEPLPVFAVTGERKQRAIRLQEPNYALPMVGRTVELQTIAEKLDLAANGQAQVIGIVAEAGMGKSRLAAEAIRLARRKGFAGYGGACQSDAITTPYHTWKTVWSAFFGVDPELPLRKQIRLMEGEIEDRAPERVEALPLLGAMLNLEIPENDFTQTLEPKDRKGVLHALLEDCLKAAAQDEPLLIIIEDLHWIDALSHDLLEELARALTGSRICFVLAYRPPELARLVTPRLEALANFTKIELSELNPAECEQAIRAKLAQLYPSRSGAVPPLLVEKLMARAQGNPFYLEELLNFLRDRGLDPRDPNDLNKIELPDSLHTLILSRVDQLSEREKTTLRVASIIGRLFRAEWLTGYYPTLGALSQVQDDLEQLHQLDITSLDTPEPELAYLFKHIVTHEVTYESLPFATRAQLHEQLAKYLEGITAPVDTIAHHYGESNNQAKQREYYQKAGEAAQEAFANDAALEYFAKLLPLLTDPSEQMELHIKRGDVMELSGQWVEAEVEYQAALTIAEQTQNAHARVRCQLAFSLLVGDRGDYRSWLDWAKQAIDGAETVDDPILKTRAILNFAGAQRSLGDYSSAQKYSEQVLALAREQGDLKITSRALRNLAGIAVNFSNFELARLMYEESLSLAREVGYKPLIAYILNDYGVFLRDIQGELAAAQACFTEELALVNEMGDKLFAFYVYWNMGAVAEKRGQLSQALTSFEQSLTVTRALGAKREMADGLYGLSSIYLAQGDYSTAQRLLEESSTLYHETGFKVGIASTSFGLGLVALATNNLTKAQSHLSESLPLWQEMENLDAIASVNLFQGIVAILQDQAADAKRLGTEALTRARESGISINIAGTLCNVGFIAYHQQDYAKAQEHYLEALKLYSPSEYRGFDWADAWAGLARAFMRQPANTARGVQLAAVTDKILKDMGAVLWTIVRVQFDDALAFAKENLGEAGFQSAWEAGQKLSMEEAVAYATGDRDWGSGDGADSQSPTPAPQ